MFRPILFSAIIFFVSAKSFAAESNLSLDTTNHSTLDLDNVEFDEPSFLPKSSISLFLGGGHFVDGGTGIVVGAQAALPQAPRIGFGLDYAKFQSSDGNPKLETLDGYANAQLVRFNESNFNYSGDLLAGFVFETSGSEVSEFFYGAALSMNYKRQAGLKFDDKISDKLGTQYTLSLVGFY